MTEREREIKKPSSKWKKFAQKEKKKRSATAEKKQSSTILANGTQSKRNINQRCGRKTAELKTNTTTNNKLFIRYWNWTLHLECLQFTGLHSTSSALFLLIYIFMLLLLVFFFAFFVFVFFFCILRVFFYIVEESLLSTLWKRDREVFEGKRGMRW